MGGHLIFQKNNQQKILLNLFKMLYQKILTLLQIFIPLTKMKILLKIDTIKAL